LASNLRFDGQILDAGNGELVRILDPIAGPRDSLETVVERVAQAFATGTVALLVPGEGWLTRTSSLPPNPAAYQAYEAGADAFCERRFGPAAERFSEAIAQAPSWPAPRFSLMVSLSNAGRYSEQDSVENEFLPLVPSLTPGEREYWEYWTAPTPRERVRALERMFRRARTQSPHYGYLLALYGIQINQMQLAREGVLAIDFDYPCFRTWPAAWSLTTLVHYLLGEYPAALERALDGRRRFPGNDDLVVWEARVRAAQGEADRVTLLADTLRNLPVSSQGVFGGLLEMGLALRVHGHPDASATLLEETLQWIDGHPDIDLLYRGLVLYYLERYEEALPYLEGVSQVSQISQGRLALTLDALGRAAEADSVLAQAPPRSRYPALLAARRGDVERAVDLLRDNFAAEMPHYTVSQIYLHRDPELEPIRDHAHFRALMRPTG
jgi:tetratricopeptide (TPR) repeat protein